MLYKDKKKSYFPLPMIPPRVEQRHDVTLISPCCVQATQRTLFRPQAQMSLRGIYRVQQPALC